MWPDDADARGGPADEVRTGTILDADLVSIDAALRAAGSQAERSLRGRTQPTRWFAIGLRTRLVDLLREPAGDEVNPATPP